MTTRTCRVCKKEFPLDELKKDPRCKHGREKLCKSCHYLSRVGYVSPKRVLHNQIAAEMKQIRNESVEVEIELYDAKIAIIHAHGYDENKEFEDECEIEAIAYANAIETVLSGSFDGILKGLK